MQQLYSLFKEVEFDVMHFYSMGRVPGTFRPEDTYSFGGKAIDTSLHHLLNGIMESDPYTEFFAVCRFFISAELEALVVRGYYDPEHRLHYLVYDNAKQAIIKDVELSYSYGYEGSEGNMESWIIDVNKDGQKDIVTRSLCHTLSGSEAELTVYDTIIVSVWKGNELLRIGISDSLLRKNLEEDFPFYTPSYIGYYTQEQLSALLKEKVNIETPQYDPKNYWNIITGSSKTLEEAENEINRSDKIIGMNYKYDLDIRRFEINKKDGVYYTVITGFDSKAETEIALKEIKNKISNSARMIRTVEWCENLKYHPGGQYRDCIK
jgi:hypothetical protein